MEGPASLLRFPEPIACSASGDYLVLTKIGSYLQSLPSKPTLAAIVGKLRRPGLLSHNGLTAHKKDTDR